MCRGHAQGHQGSLPLSHSPAFQLPTRPAPPGALPCPALPAGNLGACRTTFLLQHPSNRRLLTPMQAPAPAPGCMVCGRAQVGTAGRMRREGPFHAISV